MPRQLTLGIMKIVLALISIFFISLSISQAAPLSCAASVGLRQLDQSNNLSQFVRANTPHFWRWFSGRLHESTRLNRLARDTATLPGDNNAANFSFVESTDGWAIKYVDFDDVAPNLPVLGVLTNATVQASARLEVKAKEASVAPISEDLVQAFYAGIEGDAFEMPKFIANILRQSPKDVRQTVEAYVKSKTKKGERTFDTDHGELNPLRFRSVQQKRKFEGEIAKILGLPEAKILDLAVRPKDRGGSANQKRIWVLAEFKKGTRIVEFKEQGISGTEQFAANQLPVEDRVGRFQREFNGIFEGDYFLGFEPFIAKVSGTEYLVKEKEPTLLDIDRLNDEKVLKLFAYQMYLMGQAVKFQKQIPKADRQQLLDAVSALALEYFGVVRKTYRNAQ